MNFALLAASIAILAPLASDAMYQAAWTIKGDQCDGQISLGEFTSTETCTSKDCGPIEGNVPGLSTKTLCVESHKAATSEILGSYNKPYALMEVYAPGTDCAGAFTTAVGVIADGTCYTGANGNASYKVTWDTPTGTVWLQYDDALCKGKERRADIWDMVANGDTCLYDTFKVYVIAPSGQDGSMGATGGGSNSSTTAPAAVAGYQAAWTIKGDTCDGQISLGEFTATAETCTPKDCAPISADVPGLSTKTMCVKTRADATKMIIGDYSKPYVLMEVYAPGTDCAGAFTTAVGVIADGTCYTGANGNASYKVTWDTPTGTVWLQYDDALCKGKERRADIWDMVAKGDTCLYDTFKVYVIAPSAESKGTTGNTSQPSATAPTIAPTPAPTASAASPSVSVSVAVAVSVSAMAAIASAVVW